MSHGGAVLERRDDVGRCARLFREVERAVADAGVRDAQATLVKGLPYLRTTRLLTAIRPEPSGAAFAAWVDRLRTEAHLARRAELANLPTGTANPRWPQALDTCAATLLAHDLERPGALEALQAARVPDDYRLALRVLGLYPLASIPFLQGVRGLHRDTDRTFTAPLDELAVHGRLRRIGPPASGARLDAAAVAALLERAAANPLGLADPDETDLRQLGVTFAPIFEIDTATRDDRPGRPYWADDPHPRVADDPVVYLRTSHALWQGQKLLQLNYVIWFPARPREARFDLVAGRLDGLTWRVTLGQDGRPLVYDAVHNCGCYHKVFPTPRVRLERRRRGWEEPLSVPQTVADGAGPLVLRIASGTHYLQRVHPVEAAHAADGAEAYALESYEVLRSLPAPDGSRRSLFRPDGIVPGTQRPERWLFWPMGVPEPGAMRQWGNHAIAFVGRRHFDDPRLLERYFAPATPP